MTAQEAYRPQRSITRSPAGRGGGEGYPRSVPGRVPPCPVLTGYLKKDMRPQARNQRLGYPLPSAEPGTGPVTGLGVLPAVNKLKTLPSLVLRARAVMRNN